MDHLNKEILWLTYNNKHLAVALCSIHVELYDWLQVCLCFRRGIYRKSLWNKHDTTTIAQNFTDFFHQYNRCPSLQIKGTVCLSIQSFDHSVVCPFSRLSIHSFDHSVVWPFSRLILMFPTYVHFPESLQNLLCSALQQMSDLAVHHEVMSHHVKGLIVLWVVPLQVIYNGHLQTLFLPLRYHFD